MKRKKKLRCENKDCDRVVFDHEALEVGVPILTEHMGQEKLERGQEDSMLSLPSTVTV